MERIEVTVLIMDETNHVTMKQPDKSNHVSFWGSEFREGGYYVSKVASLGKWFSEVQLGSPVTSRNLRPWPTPLLSKSDLIPPRPVPPGNVLGDCTAKLRRAKGAVWAPGISYIQSLP
eukprot:sb/3476413/